MSDWEPYGRFVIDCYNNGTVGWLHILPVNDPEASEYIKAYNKAKDRTNHIFKEVFPYNNSWWCIVEAPNVMQAMQKFLEIYKAEVCTHTIRDCGIKVTEYIHKLQEELNGKT